MPDLANAAVNTTVKKSPWYRSISLISKAGVNFTSFAKSKNFRKDLYADWVAPMLDTDLLVETWPNGAGRLPSKCANHSRYCKYYKLRKRRCELKIRFVCVLTGLPNAVLCSKRIKYIIVQSIFLLAFLILNR